MLYALLKSMMKKRFLALSIVLATMTGFLPYAQAYEGQFFLVTAYYSPLPWQSYYLHGNYETEIRVNGRGTHGASGHAVRPGMIAAPRNYPFWAKIALEGIGIGTVLDRWGAIVEAAQSGSFTRLDVYLWAGEEGLCRAKKFGIQTIYGTVFTIEESKEIGEDTIDFSAFDGDCSFVTGDKNEPLKFDDPRAQQTSESSLREKVLSSSVSPSSIPDEVRTLKKIFRETGYLIGRVDGDYDTQLTNTIYRFQISQDIIQSPYDDGAGYYGPKTRAALRKVLYKKDEDTKAASTTVVVTEEPPLEPDTTQVKQAQTSIFDTRITKDSHQDDIRELQFILNRVGFYEGEQDGIYDTALVDSIYRFQIDNDVISSQYDTGAGYYGPATRAKLKSIYNTYSESQEHKKKLRAIVEELENKRVALIAAKKRDYESRLDAMGDLRNGDVNPRVRDLQILLRDRGYLDHKDTAIFGPMTQSALAKYQLDLGTIDRIDSPYAGILWPVTRKAIIADLTRRFHEQDKTYLAEIESTKQQLEEAENT